MEYEQKPLTGLLTEFAKAAGLRFRRDATGVTCETSNGILLTLFDRPVFDSRLPTKLILGTFFDPKRKQLSMRYMTDDIAGYLRRKLTEYLELHELKQKIMDPKHLETAERMSKKRRELQALYNLLSNYHNSAIVTVTVPTNYAADGRKQKEAAIQSDTFNAIMAALVEKAIKNIDEFVKLL